MLIDHIGYLLLPDLLVLRLVGRLSFPIFAFLAADSYGHTRSLGRYLLRLGLFALGFQALYAYCMATERLSIFATLFLGVAAIRAYHWLKERLKGQLGLALGLLAAVLIALAAQVLRADYGCYGVGLIFTAYVCRGKLLPLSCAWLALTSLALSPGAA